MNEGDYETEDAVAEAEAAGAKRKAEGGSAEAVGEEAEEAAPTKKVCAARMGLPPAVAKRCWEAGPACAVG